MHVTLSVKEQLASAPPWHMQLHASSETAGAVQVPEAATRASQLLQPAGVGPGSCFPGASKQSQRQCQHCASRLDEEWEVAFRQQLCPQSRGTPAQFACSNLLSTLHSSLQSWHMSVQDCDCCGCTSVGTQSRLVIVHICKASFLICILCSLFAVFLLLLLLLLLLNVLAFVTSCMTGHGERCCLQPHLPYILVRSLHQHDWIFSARSTDTACTPNSHQQSECSPASSLLVWSAVDALQGF